MQERVCALEGCEETFLAKVHNQRFHSKECCRVYTNARILEQYHAKRKAVKKDRICASDGCGTVLSIYNSNKFCGSCEDRQFRDKLVKWGWSEETEF